ncbi:MAG: hypothetical protein ORN54_09320 [Cyclobacteriaceae bacterium]|nr:hypothetical protein [Cyclobacteriaceae bacterium]
MGEGEGFNCPPSASQTVSNNARGHPDIGHSSQTITNDPMALKATNEERLKEEKRFTHRTATRKILAHAFGTCHCHTSSPQT